MTKFRNIATKFSKESQLLAPVARFARRRGFCVQHEELPFYEYRIDLYGFSREQDETIAIELKLSDWRGALLQAMLYQLCADRVYIAMPESSAGRVEISELESTGVGLIAVCNSGRCNCLLPAKAHAEVRQRYRFAQIEYITGLAHA